MAEDLKIAEAEKKHITLAIRLNYQTSGVSSLFRKTGRQVKKWDIPNDGPYREKLLDVDKDWGDHELWRVIQTYSSAYTSGYFLNAADMELGPEGVQQVDDSQKIYVMMFKRTMFLSIVITVSCIALGYPVAFLLANLPLRTSNL
ncbi:ABC transporter permease, partial [Escherichia coli]|nr:ABC transporter permease [Escherichia coli]